MVLHDLQLGGEKVYAWKPMEDIGIADLPEGVTEA